MLGLLMRPPGAFKLRGRARRATTDQERPQPHPRLAGPADPYTLREDRSDRIVDSLRMQILDDENEQSLRIRQVFEVPREIYRVEIERPELSYQRTTLLDRDALEDLLATDDIRERVLELLE